MRNVLLLSLFLSTLVSPLFADENRKSLPDFWVVSSEKDPSLPSGESVFEFEVMNPEFRIDGGMPGIAAAYNQTGEFPFVPDGAFNVELKVPAGSYTFQFFTPYYLEIYSELTEIQSGYRTKVQLRFSYSDMEIISDKPVIYLYPEKDTEVNVTVAPKKEFTFTYPVYENGWKGTAHPDGSMTVGGKNYPYLFWESENTFRPSMIDPSEGFVVDKDKTVAFLEEQLTAMGLSDREQADFITYWGPRMTANERNYVYFLFNDDVNAFATLGIDPQPEHLFRVYMIWSPMPPGAAYDLTPQQMQTIDRTGFYAIEWGGSEIPMEEKTVVLK